MVSKTSMLPLVRAFDWKAVDAGLREKPQLVTHRDERGRNGLHVCCATSLDGRDPKSSIRTADVIMAHGIDLRGHAFTEGRWRATSVWYCALPAKIVETLYPPEISVEDGEVSGH